MRVLASIGVHVPDARISKRDYFMLGELGNIKKIPAASRSEHAQDVLTASTG
jgi:hypothetical protein